MNQAFKRDAASFLKVVPLASSQDLLLNSSLDDTGGSSFYGNVLDLNDLKGYETAIAIVSARTYIATSETAINITGHWVTDTSSAFGGSTTLGSTYTIAITASSAQSSEMGALVAPVNLNDAGCYRYVRFLYVCELTSGDNETATLAPVYVLAGGDNLPSTNSSQYPAMD